MLTTRIGMKWYRFINNPRMKMKTLKTVEKKPQHLNVKKKQKNFRLIFFEKKVKLPVTDRRWSTRPYIV